MLCMVLATGDHGDVVLVAGRRVALVAGRWWLGIVIGGGGG